MNLDNLADRYELAAHVCRWAEQVGGYDEAIRQVEAAVAEDVEDDIDFVVASVLSGHIDELTTRSLKSGIVRLDQGLGCEQAKAEN